MTSMIAKYFEVLFAELADLAQDQVSILEKAAGFCADALASRNVIYIYDTGHIISQELVARTGGLVAYTHLSFEGVLNNENLWRKEQRSRLPNQSDQSESEEKLIDWVLSRGTMKKGDILIIGSVSGVSIRVVELAIQARRHGMFVIALTAPSFSRLLESKHPSGMRLYEVADLVLDSHTEYGDAFLEVEGIEHKICPLSGISAAILMWALTAGIVERLRDAGIQPSIYQSVNLPDGPARVENVEAKYREQGV